MTPEAGGTDRAAERPPGGAVPAGTRGAARDRLLADVLAYARTHGLGELSLRSLSAAIGTSHRMLLYHFGSRDGLLAAVVAAVEAEQRAVLEGLTAGWAVDPVATQRAFWAGLADPGMADQECLFFEMVARVLRGRPGTELLRGALVDDWLDAFEATADRLGVDRATLRVDARLGMAVTRGLLLDLLLSGDRAGVDAAMERFVALMLPGEGLDPAPAARAAARESPAQEA